MLADRALLIDSRLNGTPTDKKARGIECLSAAIDLLQRVNLDIATHSPSQVNVGRVGEAIRLVAVALAYHGWDIDSILDVSLTHAEYQR